MSIYIDPSGHRSVVPAHLTRSEVKRLRAAARGKRGTRRGKTQTTEQPKENPVTDPDPAERFARIRQHMATEAAKMPAEVDHNGYGPGHRPAWHVPSGAEAEQPPGIEAAPMRSGPKPDPSQGARGSGFDPPIDQQIRDAQDKGDWRTVISLQHQKHGADRAPSGRNNPYWQGPSAG